MRTASIAEETAATEDPMTSPSTYRRSFVVAVPVARAWKAFIDPKERENYVAPPGRRGDAWEAGELKSIVEGLPPTDIEIGPVEPMRSINYREGVRLRWNEGDTAVTDWLDVTVTFEEEHTGTRITFTRSGFGDSEEWQFLRQSQSLGMDETLADLVFYLETGVPVHAARHFAMHTAGSIAASMLERHRGVEIRTILPGGFAAQAGLQPGDTLVTVAGASIYSRADVHTVERALGPGAEVEVTYVRDGKLQTASARLSEPHFTSTRGVRGA